MRSSQKEETEACELESEDAGIDVSWKDEQIEKQQQMVSHLRGVMSVFSNEVF